MFKKNQNAVQIGHLSFADAFSATKAPYRMSKKIFRTIGIK